MESLSGTRTAANEPADEFVFDTLFGQVAALVEEKRTSHRIHFPFTDPFEVGTASWRGFPIPCDPPPELTVADVTVVCDCLDNASGLRVSGMSGTGEFFTLSDVEVIPVSVNGFGFKVKVEDVDLKRLFVAGMPATLFVEFLSGIDATELTYDVSNVHRYKLDLNGYYAANGNNPCVFTVHEKASGDPLLPDTGSQPLTWQTKWTESDDACHVEPLLDSDIVALAKTGNYEVTTSQLSLIRVRSILVEYKKGTRTEQSRIPDDIGNPLTTGKIISARHGLLLYGMQETLFNQRTSEVASRNPVRIIDMSGTYQRVAEFVVDAGRETFDNPLPQVRRDYEVWFDWAALTRTDEELIASMSWEAYDGTRTAVSDGEDVGALTIDALNWQFTGREGYVQRVYAQARAESHLTGLFNRDGYRFARWSRYNATLRLTDNVRYLKFFVRLENAALVSEFSSYNRLVVCNAAMRLAR